MDALRVAGRRWRVLGRARFALAFAFALAAAYHLAAVIWPALGPSDSAARHGVFVAVDAALAVGFAWPPRWLALPMALLCAQQLFSHGGDVVRAWRDGRRVDWASVAVVATMPAALAVAIAEGLRLARARPGGYSRASCRTLR
jgi:hypothetical protein